MRNLRIRFALKASLPILALFLFMRIGAHGQTPDIEIDTHVSGPATVCGDPVTFSITLKNITSTPINSVKLYPRMPSGLVYVTNTAVGMTYGGESPELFFNVGDLGIDPENREKIVTFQAKANCNLINYLETSGQSQTLVNNQTRVTYSLNGDKELFEPNGSESYSVLYAQLEVFTPQNEKNIAVDFINVVKNRHITIKNSGLGRLASVDFYMKYDGELRVDKLELQTAAGPVVLTYASTDPLLGYKYTITDFSGAQNGDAFLDEGEQIMVTDYVAAKASKASIETVYTVRWGCDALVCNTGANQASFAAYVQAIGGKAYVSMMNPIIKKTDFCDDTPAQIHYDFTNQGSGSQPASRDGAFDFKWIYKNSFFGANSTFSFFIRKSDGTLLTLEDYVSYVYKESQALRHSTTYYDREYVFDFNNKESLTTDIDGPGGLDDIDGDGYFDDLPVGQTLKLAVYVKHTFDTPIELGMENGAIMSSDVRYSQWSGVTGVLEAGTPVAPFFNLHLYRYELSGPADLVDGQTHAMKLDVSQSYSSGGYIHHGDAIFEFEIEVPPGVLVQEAVYAGRTLPIAVENGKYFIRDPLTKIPSNFILDLKFALTCPVGAANQESQVTVKAYYYNDYGCPNARLNLFNVSKSAFLHCGACNTIQTSAFSVRRSTLGWVMPPSANVYGYKYGDLYGPNAKVAKVTPSTPAINLSAALPKDEVEVTITGLAVEASGNLSAEILYESPFDFEAFRYSSCSIVVGSSEFQLPAVQPEKVVNGKNYNYIFRIPIGDVVPALPAQSNVVFKAKYTVSDLAGIINGRYPVKTFRGVLFYEDENGQRIDCLSFGDDDFEIFQSYLLNENGAPFSSTVALNATGRTAIAEFVTVSATQSSFDFPNEFRPLYYLNSFTATLPKGFVFDTSRPVEALIGKPLFLAYDGVTFSEDKRTISLRLTDNLPVTFLPQILYAYVKVDCSTPGNIFEPKASGADFRDIPYTFAVNRHANLPAGPHPVSSLFTATLRMMNFRRANLKLTANSEQDGYSEFVKWPIQLINPEASGFGSSTFTWVAVELKSTDNSTIIDQINDATGNSVPFARYGPTDTNNPDGRHILVQLGTLNVSQSAQYEIVGKYKNCEEGILRNIDVFASWDPYAYPNITTQAGTVITTSIKDVKSCEGNLTADVVSIRYKTAALQWSVAKLGPERAELCVPVPFEIDLTSTKYGDMQQLKIMMDLPENVTIDQGTLAAYQYPYTSAPISIPPNAFILEDGRTGIDISILTGGNLPGIRLPDNKIKLLFNLITSCGFDPGLPIKYTVTGYTNCGDFISYVDQRKIKMNGFELDALDLTLTATATPATCSSSNVISLSIRNDGTTLSSENRLEILLPEGTDYQQMVHGDLGAPTESQVGSQTKLQWTLPDGYVSVGASKTLSFSVFINSTPLGAPEISFEAHTYEHGNLNCVADGSTCATEATTGTGKLVLPMTGIASLDVGYEKYVCAYKFTHSIAAEDERTSCEIISYAWDFGDGVTSTEIEPYHAFNPGTYTISLTVTFNCNGCGGTATKQIQLIVSPDDISLEQQIISVSTDIKKEVLQVSAATFSDSWPLSFDDVNLNDKSSFLNGSEGVWRNDGAFVYQQERKLSQPLNVAKDGTFDIESFNWEHADLDAIPNWTRATTMTEYSPFSYELENRDVLGIYSAALYDYGGHLPSANGANMRNREMAFTSFEFPDAESQSRFFDVSNGITGNWMLGQKPVPKYSYFMVDVGQKNVATVEASMADLENVVEVDVIAKSSFPIIGLRARFIQANKIVCRQQHPENPEWSVIVLERPVADGIWTGKVRIRQVASSAIMATFDNAVVHSGRASLKVTTDDTYKQPLLRLEEGKAYAVNAWVSVNRPNVTTPVLADYLGFDIAIRDKSGAVINTFSFAPSGKIIEGWQQVKGSFVSPLTDGQVEITFKSGSTGVAWYDDLRLHPLKGNMKAYVYDVTDYRLRAILDEENFASFFYYDREGNLHITKKETEDGIKTLTENVSYQVSGQ